MATNAPFKAILADAGQPDAVAEQLAGSLNGLYELITRHNSRALRIQETKALDPNDTTLLDAKWRAGVEDGSAPDEIVEAEAKYQAVMEEITKLEDTLRAWAKTQIKPPLSEEEVTKERALANEEAKLIADETPAAEALAKLADTMLAAVSKAIPGGLFSLMPDVISVKPTRGGRKASGDSGTPIYRTRMDLVVLDGVPAERKKTKAGVEITESNFQVAADVLNAKWNAERFPENTVTDEELERAMYAAAGNAFRDKTNLPEKISFEFQRTIKVQNPNDDNTTDLPQTVKIDATRNVKVSGAAAAKVEEKAATETATESDTAKSTDESKSDESAKPAESKPAETKSAPANSAPANPKAAAIAAAKGEAKK